MGKRKKRIPVDAELYDSLLKIKRALGVRSWSELIDILVSRYAELLEEYDNIVRRLACRYRSFRGSHEEWSLLLETIGFSKDALSYAVQRRYLVDEGGVLHVDENVCKPEDLEYEAVVIRDDRQVPTLQPI